MNPETGNRDAAEKKILTVKDRSQRARWQEINSKFRQFQGKLLSQMCRGKREGEERRQGVEKEIQRRL